MATFRKFKFLSASTQQWTSLLLTALLSLCASAANAAENHNSKTNVTFASRYTPQPPAPPQPQQSNYRVLNRSAYYANENSADQNSANQTSHYSNYARHSHHKTHNTASSRPQISAQFYYQGPTTTTIQRNVQIIPPQNGVGDVYYSQDSYYLFPPEYPVNRPYPRRYARPYEYAVPNTTDPRATENRAKQWTDTSDFNR